MSGSLSHNEALAFLHHVVRQQLGRQSPEVEDIASRAYYKVLKYSQNKTEGADPWTFAYLRSVAKSAVSDWVKSQSLFITESEGDSPEPSGEEAGFGLAEHQAEFSALLSGLPEQDRMFAVLIFLAATSGVEDRLIALYLGIAPSTYSYRKLRLLSRLEELKGFRTEMTR
jgi:RNA polymerase sigma factor (sigma-70 family)